jgi:protein TonB
MPTESRLITTSGASLLLHAAVLSALAAGPQSPAMPYRFENIEVVLAGASPVRAARPVAAVAATGARAVVEAPADRDTVADRDEARVEARHDVAGLNNPKPAYPLTARRRGLQGRVVIAAQVRGDGRCTETRIRHSSGHELLDNAARDAVRRWHFVPARRGDTPIDAWVEVPIVFRLDS